jgi:hypothetical protein
LVFGLHEWALRSATLDQSDTYLRHEVQSTARAGSETEIAVDDVSVKLLDEVIAGVVPNENSLVRRLHNIALKCFV